LIYIRMALPCGGTALAKLCRYAGKHSGMRFITDATLNSVTKGR